MTAPGIEVIVTVLLVLKNEVPSIVGLASFSLTVVKEITSLTVVTLLEPSFSAPAPTVRVYPVL